MNNFVESLTLRHRIYRCFRSLLVKREFSLSVREFMDIVLAVSKRLTPSEETALFTVGWMHREVVELFEIQNASWLLDKFRSGMLLRHLVLKVFEYFLHELCREITKVLSASSINRGRGNRFTRSSNNHFTLSKQQ